ncbi:histidine phosphatase family protein [Lysobacter korlensis]|uniref:Histidine phosphatase family protein n=1 Tax=Lysobacter korlensis TaxID=553636 RepID=A0ABV6RRY9_9GAMM
MVPQASGWLHRRCARLRRAVRRDRVRARTAGCAAVRRLMPMHVFIRHPPMPSLQGVCYGRLDAPLAPGTFERAADALAAELPDWPIVSSPTTRCLDLARALRAAALADDPGNSVPPTRHGDVLIDARLRELDFGTWEGQRWDALPRAALDAWSQDVAGFAAPGGESFTALIARVRQALAELQTPHIVVTHAGVIRAALHLCGMPLAQAASACIAHLQPIWIHVEADPG